MIIYVLLTVGIKSCFLDKSFIFIVVSWLNVLGYNETANRYNTRFEHKARGFVQYLTIDNLAEPFLVFNDLFANPKSDTESLYERFFMCTWPSVD